jgi:D-beta-D-heptose 7-phosphate kinase / D-beta-D-heptose 1-phosphate adenosyltransferase
MRLDIERKLQLDAGQMDALSDWLQEADKVEAIVLSDYAKGVLTPKMIRRVISIAQSRRIPVVVDPKSRDVARYAGATVLTPNAPDAVLIAGVECDADEGAEACGKDSAGEGAGKSGRANAWRSGHDDLRSVRYRKRGGARLYGRVGSL